MQEEHTAVACDDCRGILPRTLLAEHAQTQCLHTLELVRVDGSLMLLALLSYLVALWIQCATCGFKFKRKDFQAHVLACTSRTERCEVLGTLLTEGDSVLPTHVSRTQLCNAYIQVTAIPEHTQLCALTCPEHHDESDLLAPGAIAKALDKQQQKHLACGYCAKSGFPTAALLQHHIAQSCTLAKPFGRNEERVSSNQENEQPSAAIQGRLRRQSDAHALKVGARVKKKPIAPFGTATKLPTIPNMRPAAVRSRAKAQQTTPLVAISGTAMARVHELSQQQPPTATPAFHCISHGNGHTNQRAASRSTATTSSSATGRPSISIRPQRLGR